MSHVLTTMCIFHLLFQAFWFFRPRHFLSQFPFQSFVCIFRLISFLLSNAIWNLKAPPKVKVFAWLVINEKINININIML